MRDPGCDNEQRVAHPGPAGPGRAASPPRSPPLAPGFALPGTLTDRMTRCGHPNCRCHADPPRLHGPYHQWTRKIDGKTVTRILTDDQLADYRPWFDSHRRLRELIAELEDPQPHHRRSRPPLEPLTRPPGTGTAAKPGTGDSLQIAWATPA